MLKAIFKPRSLQDRMLSHGVTFFLLGLFYASPDRWALVFWLALIFVLVWELVVDPKRWTGCFLWDKRSRSKSYSWTYDVFGLFIVDMQTKGFVDLQTKILALILGGLLSNLIF